MLAVLDVFLLELSFFFLALDAWAIAVPPHLLWLREAFFGSKSSIEDYSLLGK